MRAAAGCLALAACHVTTRSEITRPDTVEKVRHPEAAIARRPTIVVTEAGRFRFVEPLDCPTEEIAGGQHAVEITRGPNLATFVVGVIATSVGGILLVRGLSQDDSSNPSTYAGGALLVGGVPFAIGPWLGNGTELRPLETAAPVRRATAAEPCGERAVSAKSATLMVNGIEVFGSIDRDGVFSVSPYQLADAFEPPSSAWDIAGKIESPSGPRTVEVVIDAHALAAGAPKFLAHPDFDPKIEPMRIVPGLVPGTLRVSLAQTAGGPAARIVLAIQNTGPGPAFALRGHVTAPGTPALDGRIVYFGSIAKGATATRELLVPLAEPAAAQLRNATIDLALELRDAHGTAPTTPVRFRGAMLVDAPR